MVLTSRVAQNYEKMIKSGKHDAQSMLYNIQCAYDRNLMTLEEKVYLEQLVDEYLIVAASEKAVKELGLK